MKKFYITITILVVLLFGMYMIDKTMTRVFVEPNINDLCEFKGWQKIKSIKEEVNWNEETEMWEFGSACKNIFGETKMISLKRDMDVCKIIVCKNHFYTYSYLFGDHKMDTKLDVDGPYILPE